MRGGLSYRQVFGGEFYRHDVRHGDMTHGDLTRCSSVLYEIFVQSFPVIYKGVFVKSVVINNHRRGRKDS